MPKSNKTGWARIKAALDNSVRGLRDVWRLEEAFRLECAVLVVAIPFSLIIASTLWQAVLLLGSIVLVMIVELLNSAIEAVVDRIGDEIHELSRIAKDVGSAAVFLTMLLAGAVWLAAIWTYFSA